MTAIDQQPALCPFPFLADCGVNVCLEYAVVNGWHKQIFTLLFDKQFVPCCTTRDIFFLWKNRFIVCGFRFRQ